jgi:hypothetical protein
VQRLEPRVTTQIGSRTRSRINFAGRGVVVTTVRGSSSVTGDIQETSGEEADETGIIVAGKDQNGHGYVLADISGRYI